MFFIPIFLLYFNINKFLFSFLLIWDINFNELRTFKFQSYISNSYLSGKVRYLRSFQRLLFNSISSRLRVIRDTFYLNSSYFFSLDSFNLTSLDKFNIFFCLDYRFYHYNFYPFFILKRKGLSFFFQVPYVFSHALTALSNLSVLPLIEIFSDKAVFFYRPYRNSFDFLFYLRDFLYLSATRFWILYYDFESFLLFPFWLIKSFPIDKKFLFFWILNYYKVNNLSNLNFTSLIHNFRFSVLGFLFNGLVFVVKLIFLFYCKFFLYFFSLMK